MNKEINPTAYQALEKSLTALREHHKSDAQRWANEAAKLAPDWEAPWIVLASISEPEASIRYLKKALEINPASERARQGMHWAIKRYRKKIVAEINAGTATAETQNIPVRPASAVPSVGLRDQLTSGKPPSGKRRNKKLIQILLGLLLICILTLVAYVVAPPGLMATAQKPQGVRLEGALVKPSLTPSSTLTPTPTYTPTATFTATPTSTFTPTATHTAKPTKTKPVPLPTFTPGSEFYYEEVDPPTSGRWIDINLTYQQLYAYKGSKLVNAFLVSTGTYLHPTVTGQYTIYVKYEYDDMVGPDYYLPDVPYTMYFYEGYGIHGTYWHSNFGTPMSHGCVNMRTSDAAWLYGWASVGTIVNIHY
ncbi:MAG: L,D-transpeptidase [Chloroflexi bacterium]|nr:L,D-transpeptidase [Chloroflexota bacterium]